MELLFWSALLLGMFCTLYYIVIILYAGLKVNFSWIWCLGGIGGITGAVLIRYLIHVRFLVPEWSLRLAYILIVSAIIVFISLEGLLLLHSHHKAVRGMEYLLVLGAQIKENKVTRNLRKRLDTAIAYLADNPDTLVIVSGGRGTEQLPSEAAAMKGYLLDQGIDE